MSCPCDVVCTETESRVYLYLHLPLSVGLSYAGWEYMPWHAGGLYKANDFEHGFSTTIDSCAIVPVHTYKSSLTKTPAMPIPVPTHIEVTATLAFLRLSSDSAVTTCLVPVQPVVYSSQYSEPNRY